MNEDISRIIEMAWEDRTPFEAIHFQFGINQGQVEKLMRTELSRPSFNRWRKRVSSGISSKHLKKRVLDINRFKSKKKKQISSNKISKR